MLNNARGEKAIVYQPDFYCICRRPEPAMLDGGLYAVCEKCGEIVGSTPRREKNSKALQWMAFLILCAIALLFIVGACVAVVNLAYVVIGNWSTATVIAALTIGAISAGFWAESYLNSHGAPWKRKN
jgi:predicted nucleic acid-binding Zn ribbon protein